MSKSQYNPDIHHRRSIRLKGHDYAGGGLYFVTLCAHREYKAARHGVPFGNRATCVSPEREIIAEEWKRCGEVRDDVVPGEFVVMPDHFHGLIRIQKNKSELGHVIGAFKAAVSRRIRNGFHTGDTHVAQDMRIWHRNYYEMIVRTPEAEKKITQYIRMNPWRCVQNLGNGPANGGVNLRGMGNPSLWNTEKLGVLCSRKGDKNIAPTPLPKAATYFSGFHSPMEKEIFAKLLEQKMPVIWCPAWGVKATFLSHATYEALEQNRLLILEMRDTAGDLAAAEQRNRFVLEQADKLWLPHITPGGMLDRLVRDMQVQGKILNHGKH